MKAFVIAVAAVVAIAAAWFFVSRDSGPGEQATSVAGVMRMIQTEAEGDLAPQENYEALFGALPSGTTVTVESYEDEDGGAVARGVVLSPTSENEAIAGVALRIDELRAYDLDPEAIAVLASTEEEGQRLASRFDARGVELTGLGAALTAMTDEAYDAAGEALSSVDQTFDRYDLRAGQIVTDGLTLFGGPAVSEDEDGKAALRGYAKGVRSYGFDNAVATDMEVGVGFSQTTEMPAEAEGEAMTTNASGDGTFKIARAGASGYDRGNVALSFAEDMTGGFTMDQDGASFAYDFIAESSTQEGVRLADALGYFLAGEVPPSDETDLMSLGIAKVENMRLTMNGQPFQQINSYEIDLSEWHGLLPERVAYRSDEVFYAGGLVSMMRDMAAQVGASDPDVVEAQAQFEALATILRDANLEEVASNNEVTYEWAPGDGTTTVRARSDLAGLGSFRLDGDVALPAYEGFAAIDPATLGGEGTNPLETLMTNETAFDRLAIVLDDQGGLDRLLSAMIAYAELPANDGNSQLAMLRGQQPAGLRQMLSAGLTMASAQVATIAPQAQSFTNAASAWVRDGGTLTITLDPEEALTVPQMQALSAMPQGPGGVIDTLGMTVVHEAPAAE